MLLTPNGKISNYNLNVQYYTSNGAGLYRPTLEEVSLQTKSQMTPVIKILIQFKSTAVSKWCINSPSHWL